MKVTAQLVAIVDDDTFVRRSLGRLLRSFNFSTVEYASGSAFLSDVGKPPPDCVLLDHHMPQMTGLEVLKSLRAKGADVTAIVITGHDQPGLAEKCRDAGAAAFLTKPFAADVVVAAIRNAIRT